MNILTYLYNIIITNFNIIFNRVYNQVNKNEDQHEDQHEDDEVEINFYTGYNPLNKYDDDVEIILNNMYSI